MSAMMIQSSFNPAVHLSGRQFVRKPGHALVVSHKDGSMQVISDEQPATVSLMDRFRLNNCKVYDVSICAVSLDVPVSGSFIARDGMLYDYSAVMHITCGPAARDLDAFAARYGEHDCVDENVLVEAISAAVHSVVSRSAHINANAGIYPLPLHDLNRHKALFSACRHHHLYVMNSTLDVTHLTRKEAC